MATMAASVVPGTGLKVGEAAASGARDWRTASIALLSTRLVQGFIYWGGGSRRFIYDPAKLDPHASSWMANKLQSAMPGALLGANYVIAYLLQHFWLLYAGVILFSATELVAGAALMVGLMTRLAAVCTVGFSISLMLMFGWQGATCIDEWTMAASSLAMGATLMLAGAGAFSLDNVLLRRNPALAGRAWFRWLGGSLPLPVSDVAFRDLGLLTLAAVMAFIVGTYDYYRGSVVTLFHNAPVSPKTDHFALEDGQLMPDGAVEFRISMDGGTPEAPAHVMQIELIGADGQAIETWNTETLGNLPPPAIDNDFAYNKFKAGPYGLVGTMGATATVLLPARPGAEPPRGAVMTLKLTDVDGRVFTTGIAPSG
jgi:thiosulfate dehydrogenase (quinone)